MVFQNNKWAFWFLNYNKPHVILNQKKEAICASFLEENVVLPFEDIGLGKRPWVVR